MNKLSWAIKKTLNSFVFLLVTLVLAFTITNSQIALAEEPTANPTSEPQSTPTESPAPSSTPQPSATPSPETSPTPTPTQTPTATPAPSTESTFSPTPTTSPSPTPEATSSATPTPNSTPTPTPQPTSLNILISQVTAGTTYSSSSSNTKVKFNSISGSAGSLTILEESLSQEKIAQLKALSSTVYNISSSMPNGSFTYDLTLPYPSGVTGTNFKVFYASDINGLSSPNQVTQSITDNGDGTFTIHNLNHFTVFVVVNPSSQANCDAVTIGTTPGSTCYTTVQAAVNAANAGDTINIGSTGSPYNETVYVNKQLIITGSGNPSVTAFVLQTTPVTITGITTSVSITTPTVSLTNPVNSGNQTTASITGTGAANATVNYTISGTSSTPLTGTGTISAGGNINISVNVSSLGEGALTLTASLSSGSYTSSNATANAFKDTTGPASATGLTITNPINIGNNTSISFSGNGEAGSTVNWTLSNGASSLTGTTTVSGAGTFSVSGRNVSGFPDGTVTLSVTLTDSSGNTSTASTKTATKDTVAPSMPDARLSEGINIANQTNSTLLITGEVGSTYNYTITNGTITQTGTGVIPVSGTASVTGLNLSTFPEGTLTTSATLTDLAGNISVVGSDIAIKDTVTPILTSVSISSNNVNTAYAKTGDTITINLTGSEDLFSSILPTITLFGNNLVATNISGNLWRVTYTLTSTNSEGIVPFIINFQDTVTNPGVTVTTTTNSSSVTFDRTNPTLISSTITSSNANSSFAKTGDTITLTFTGSETLQTPVVTIGGNSVTPINTSGNIWTATYVMTGTYTEGLISYTISYQDLASNAGTSVSNNSTITFDRTVPTLTATTITSSNSNGNYAKAGDTITLTFTGSETLQTPVVTIGGNSATVSSLGGNNWRATYTLAGTDTQGSIGFSISFSDTAGNTGTIINSTTNSSAVTFDKTNPTIATSITTSNANSNFAKTGDTITVTLIGDETLQTPVVTIGGNTVTPVNTAGNTWVATYIMTGIDTQGLITYTISFQDLASNAGTSISTNSTITFDRTNPTLLSNSLVSSNSNSSFAKAGDTVTLNFTASESIQAPIVAIGGNSVVPTNTAGNTWVATYVMTGIDTQGLITYTISFQDLASNAGTSISTNSTIVFDRTTPTLSAITISSSNANPSYARVGNTITVTSTGSENLQTPTVTIGGNIVTPVNTSGNIWTATYTMTSTNTEGFILYTISYADLAGNSRTTGSLTSTIVFDRTNPIIAAINVSSNNSNSLYARVGNTITITFNASETLQTPSVAIAGQAATVVNTSGNNWSATYTLTSTDIEGLIVYTISYQDLASNSATTGNITSVVTFDKTNPTGSWITPVVNSTVSGTVALTASATDTNGIASVVYAYQRNDGVDTFHTIATLNSGPFTTNWNASGLVLDNYTLRITVTDNAGNSINVDRVIALATVINQSSIGTNSTTYNGTVITWTTADPTGSRVIFDTVSHPTLGTAPNYGYSNSTGNFDTVIKVLNHNVTLGGLNANTTYYYRTVSSGSPEAVSQEFSFTTPKTPETGNTTQGAPVCTDQKPGNAPALLSAKVKGNKVILTWGKAKDPVTYYLIKYGLGHDSYQFGVPNVGNVTEYEIGGLQSGVTYYFRVRAGNGCNAGGEFSNELSVKIGTSITEAVVITASNLLGAKEAYASEIDVLSASEASKSSIEASVSGSIIEATPSANHEIKKQANNLLRNILVGSGVVLLITSGLFYYSTLQKKS